MSIRKIITICTFACGGDSCTQLDAESLAAGSHTVQTVYWQKLLASLGQTDCLGHIGCAMEEWGTRNDGTFIEDFMGANAWWDKELLESDILNCYDREADIESYYSDWRQITATHDQLGHGALS